MSIVDITAVPLLFLIFYSLVSKLEICFKYFLDKNPQISHSEYILTFLPYFRKSPCTFELQKTVITGGLEDFFCQAKYAKPFLCFSIFQRCIISPCSLILEKVFKTVYNIFCWVLENVDTENS